MQHIQQVKEGKMWVPMYEEVRLRPCPKPPLKNFVLKAVENALQEKEEWRLQALSELEQGNIEVTDELQKAIKRPFVLNMTGTHSLTLNGFSLSSPHCNRITDFSAKVIILRMKNSEGEGQELRIRTKPSTTSFSTISQSICRRPNTPKSPMLPTDFLNQGMIYRSIRAVSGKRIKKSKKSPI